MLGAKQKMFMLNEGPKKGQVSCTSIPKWTQANFNASWSKGAKYEGVEWYHGRLCHMWSNVFPFVVQVSSPPFVVVCGVFGFFVCYSNRYIVPPHHMLKFSFFTL